MQVIQVNQQNLKHMKMNRYKMKEMVVMKVSNESAIMEVVERVQKENCKKGDVVFVYGESNYVSQKVVGMKDVVYKKENLTKEEVWSWRCDLKMVENHRMLREKLDEMKDERKMDLYVFGRIKMEIKEHIENYQLKTNLSYH
jgi:hypothetical protein